MSRSILTLFVVALATSIPAADVVPGSELGKGILVPSNLGIATNVSPDAQAATIIFDNLFVEISSARKGAAATHNQTAIQSKVATLHIPYKTDQRSVKMTMDLRGFTDIDSAASARLVACVGNKTEVVNLLAGKAKKLELKGKSKSEFTAEHPETQYGDWQHRIEFTVQTHADKPVLQITLFLLVEHDTDTADAGSSLLAVDSLDLEIAKSGKAAYTP